MQRESSGEEALYSPTSPATLDESNCGGGPTQPIVDQHKGSVNKQLAESLRRAKA